MTAGKESIALKPYLESIKKMCESLSKEKLTDIMLRIAEEVPVRERMPYLDRLTTLAHKRKVKVSSNILSRIQALKEELTERATAIEDGSFFDGDYEDEYDYNYDWYDEEESPPNATDEQLAELESLFTESGKVFLAGECKLAGQALHELLELFPRNQGEAYLLSDYEVKIDMREARARYGRCVYETTAEPERVIALLEALSLDPPEQYIRTSITYGNCPLLADIINSKPGELTGWDKFIKAWKKQLVTRLDKLNTERVQLLLLEATFLTEGIHGVSQLARKWEGKKPQGYLYWIYLLEQENDWQNVAAAAQEALATVTAAYARSQLAEKLFIAGEHLKDKQLILRGRREFFYAEPDQRRLLNLLTEAEQQDKKQKELNALLTGFTRQTYRKEDEKQVLKVKILLLAGKLAKVFQYTKNAQAVGWSGDSPTGIIFAAILAALILHYNKKSLIEAETVLTVLKEYADENDSDYGYAGGRDEDDDEWFAYKRGPAETAAEKKHPNQIAMSEEILAGLKEVKLTAVIEKKYLDWAVAIGKRRVEHIVSNKHRRAYPRAAEVLGALTECLLTLGQKSKALRLINYYRNEKFNRYYAFKAEVDAVGAESPLLRGVIKQIKGL